MREQIFCSNAADAACIVLREFPYLGGENHLILAIDGRCAAGKTSLGAELGAYLECPVLHMDDFFLSPKQRTFDRMEEAGGNVDRERFLTEVLQPLRQGETFSYRPYDCRYDEFTAPVLIHPGHCAIVEGTYSCHPDLRNEYDLRIFLTVEPEVQRRRIRLRDGAPALKNYTERWIPMEERYFSVFDPEGCCALTLRIGG